MLELNLLWTLYNSKMFSTGVGMGEGLKGIGIIDIVKVFTSRI